MLQKDTLIYKMVGVGTDFIGEPEEAYPVHNINKEINFGKDSDNNQYDSDGNIRDYIYMSVKNKEVYYNFYFSKGRFYYINHKTNSSITFDLAPVYDTTTESVLSYRLIKNAEPISHMWIKTIEGKISDEDIGILNSNIDIVRGSLADYNE